MNAYGMIAIGIVIILLGHFFNLVPAVEQLVSRLADIPTFEDTGDRPAFNLAVRLAYLIALVGIIKILFSRGERD